MIRGERPATAIYSGALAQTWRAFVTSPTGVAAGVVVALLATLAIFAPVLWSEQAAKLDMFGAYQGPSWHHLLGTDRVGRDVLLRMLVATRLSLEMGVGGIAIGALIGIPLGTLVGLSGSRAADVGRRLIDLWLSFPYLLMVIFISAMAASIGIASALLAVGLASAPTLARLTSNLAASIGGREYILATRVSGVRSPRLLIRHVLPNIAEPLCITVSALFGASIVAFSSLSFLGLGIQPPAYDWGQLLSQGVRDIFIAPIASVAPGLMIAVSGMAAGYFGESLAHAMNPLIWTGAHGRRIAEHRLHRVEDRLANPSNGNARVGNASQRVLQVEELSVLVPVGESIHPIVDSISFTVGRQEIVGLVGESGSGKTQTALAIAGLTPFPVFNRATALELNGHSLLGGRRERNDALADNLGLIFQDPAASLNPALRLGTQLVEAVRQHARIGSREAAARAVDRLKRVHIPVPEQTMKKYPHELSGGMRQRVMIAMALMTEPSLIIADEPTSSIDVSLQAQIIGLLAEINRNQGTAIVLISHDIALISSVCSRVLVMYAGRIVEEIASEALVAGAAAHPYTQVLLDAIPGLNRPRGEPLVRVPGRPPNVGAIPSGCPFHPRCPVAIDRCSRERPDLLTVGRAGQRAACWIAQGATV
jgi:peptide/nickel transport system permease protein